MTQAINMPRVEIVGSFLPPEELENALNEKSAAISARLTIMPLKTA